MKDILYYLGFSHFLGIGPTKFELLMNHFKMLDKAYNAPLEALRGLLGNALAEKFDKFRNAFRAEEKRKEIENKGIIVLTRDDPRFPPQLLQISDPPICLYVKGNLGLFDFQKDLFFAIVGTRRPSSYGVQISRKFSAESTHAGFKIVSGLALGVDAQAHWACIQTGGKTVAFLGCGVDIIYPPGNKILYDAIVGGGGVVMSEFPPGMTVLKGLFIARNRLISGLSKGVMVVEGLKHSGALITARYAAEQGKEVFAPPVPLTSNLSEAPNILLKQGAKLVTSVEDILEEFDMTISPQKKEDILEKLSAEDRGIVEKLLVEPYLADELALAINVPINHVLITLSLLEVNGIIEKSTDGKFQIKDV